MTLKSSHAKIVVLTGAGISAESGLPTFRGAGGLWQGHNVEDVATPEAFARDPALVQAFYNERRRALQDPAIRPNAAHMALARFERDYDGEFLLITQNIDDLHERAGSKNIFHMHGELMKARDMVLGDVFPWRGDLTLKTPHPTDPRRFGCLRPHVVWFGEFTLYSNEIRKALQSCDIFITIGTSGQVYPASRFVSWIPKDSLSVEINTEETSLSSSFVKRITGPATLTVPVFLEELLSRQLSWMPAKLRSPSQVAEDKYS